MCMVGCLKSSTIDTFWSKISDNLACTLKRSNEWPPKSKKLLWKPTCSTPRTSAQMFASNFSSCVLGSINSPLGKSILADNYESAFRSILIFCVNGNLSSTLK